MVSIVEKARLTSIRSQISCIAALMCSRYIYYGYLGPSGSKQVLASRHMSQEMRKYVVRLSDPVTQAHICPITGIEKNLVISDKASIRMYIL